MTGKKRGNEIIEITATEYTVSAKRKDFEEIAEDPRMLTDKFMSGKLRVSGKMDEVTADQKSGVLVDKIKARLWELK